MKQKTINLLVNLGMPAHFKGVKYIGDVMEMYTQNTDDIGVTKVYRAIAKRYNTTPCGVERCIRHGFEAMFKKGNQEEIQKYFPPSQPRVNGALLSCLYLKLKEGECCESNQ